MMVTRRSIQLAALAALFSIFGFAQQRAPGTQPARTGIIGTVTSVSPIGVTLKTDLGASVTVQLADGAKVLEAQPGQKTLAGAQPIALPQVQLGDRVLARGTTSGDVFTASTLIAMKQTDIAKKQEEDEQAWQQHGVSGIVKSVDANAGTIVLQTSGFAGSRSLTVIANKETAVRRYPADSAKFSDAKPGALSEIVPGDQLRALGTRSPDGSELTAEQIVSGRFRNIAATVISADPGSATVKLLDLADKKPVTIRITGDSELRSLPPMMAQRLAMRLRGTAGTQNGNAPPQPQGGEGARVQWAGQRRAPDLQQIISRMASFNLTDLHKGDALMVVATEGSASSAPAAITVLSGVEPILSAAPSTNDAAMLLSPWNLGGGGAEAEAASGP